MIQHLSQYKKEVLYCKELLSCKREQLTSPSITFFNTFIDTVFRRAVWKLIIERSRQLADDERQRASMSWSEVTSSSHLETSWRVRQLSEDRGPVLSDISTKVSENTYRKTGFGHFVRYGMCRSVEMWSWWGLRICEVVGGLLGDVGRHLFCVQLVSWM